MKRIGRYFFTWAAVILLNGCAILSDNPHKETSFHIPAPTSGLLTETSKTALDGFAAEESGFKLLFNNPEALRWRLALIDHATSSIDLQVFIWQHDETGRLMVDRILKAAERGVKVRLLVDDFPLAFSDDGVAAVASNPNIDIRIFNPTHARGGFISPTVEWGVNFQILNRRMHNKQMIVDNRWAVLGGRNIGNPYFGLDPAYNFKDVDLLIAGPILEELSDSFDLYWNANISYPGEALSKNLSQKKKDQVLNKFKAVCNADRDLLKQTVFPVDPIDWSADFRNLAGQLTPGVAAYFHDAPIVRGERGKRLLTQLQEFTKGETHDTVVVSPYLIPSKDIMANVKSSVEKGGRVRIITASMDSNNHTMANSKYKKYRKPLLESGAEIYEFSGQPSEAMRELSDTAPVRSEFISLHIKAFMQDEKWLYIGSLNMDPRAVKINTEDILAIDSPTLTKEFFEAAYIMASPQNSWKVYLNENNRVRWKSGDEIRKRQPARSFKQRCADWFFRWMPIESQL